MRNGGVFSIEMDLIVPSKRMWPALFIRNLGARRSHQSRLKRQALRLWPNKVKLPPRGNSLHITSLFQLAQVPCICMQVLTSLGTRTVPSPLLPNQHAPKLLSHGCRSERRVALSNPWSICFEPPILARLQLTYSYD